MLVSKVISSTSSPRETAAGLYQNNPLRFIQDCSVTNDPRNVARGLPANMPFILFNKQVDTVDWLQARIGGADDGLIEKSRDMGATWVCCAFSIWLWVYSEGSSVGWGSRKKLYVDSIGNMDSIFEKLRTLVRALPWYVLPTGFNEKKHSHEMRMINPENGASITGETGDDIGRGGRKLMYFKDEALTLTSQVLTIGGWKSMGELTMNDSVVGIDGEAQSITNINDCGKFETYQIGFSDGTFVYCSPNHLWTLNEVIGKRKQVTIRVEEMYSRFKYISPNGVIQYRFRLPLIKPVNFKKIKLPLHPYVVGALIGDGGVSQVPNHSPKLTSVDHEIVSYFKKCLPDYVTMKAEKKGITYSLGDIRGRMGWKYKSRIRTLIVDIGLAGKRSWEKSIPDDYKFASVGDRIELLQGLMDTDGSAGKSGGTASYYTSSRQLADDVRFIAESLGGYATMKIKKDKRGFRDQYVLFVVLPESIKPFRLKRKLDIFGKRKNTIERSVVSVKKTGKKEPVRCITVSSEEGLYLTAGCVPTHNSAHYEHAEMIEASLGDNTDIQIDISSVNGLGNVFYRRRHALPEDRVLILDWRDHPGKTQEWYDRKKAEKEGMGLSHIFAQEVDRDYGASVEGIFIPAAWVKAAIDAHIKLGIEPVGVRQVGYDPSDEGGDLDAVVYRHGIIASDADTWSEGDSVEGAKKASLWAIERNTDKLVYDNVGIGAGTKGKLREMREEGHTRPESYGWNAGGEIKNKDQEYENTGRTNADMFANPKAQEWWGIMQRFHKTWRAVTKGIEYPHDQLISLDSNMARLNELVTELSQPKRQQDKVGRVKVEGKDDMKKRNLKSPNVAEAFVLAYIEPSEPQRAGAIVW